MNPTLRAIQGILPILDADWLARQAFLSKEGDRFCQSDDPNLIEEIALFLGKSAISSVQLRCKGNHQQAYHFANIWMQALRTHSPHIAIIINDHIEVAMALEADGVHVGQDDTPVTVCRQRLGANKIIGLSTHSVDEVLAANQSSADYMGFGPIFSTNSKTDTHPTQGVARLEEICRVAQKPVVAIGGIQQTEIETLSTSGVSAVAMISGLWKKEDWTHRLNQADEHWKKSSKPS